MRRLLALVIGLALPALAFGQTTRVLPSDSVQSACVLNAANATCVLPMAGKATAGFLVTAISTPTGITLVSESSRDGTNWDPHGFLDMDSGEVLPSIPNTSIAVGLSKTIITGGGDRYVRVKASAWTSGSATVVVTGTDTIPLVAAETDRVTSGCVLGAANAACTISTAGRSTFGFIVTAISTPTGITLVNETSRDGVSWDGHPFIDLDTGDRLTTIPNASLAVGYTRTMTVGGGVRYARVRASAWTSGSATVQVVGSGTMAIGDPSVASVASTVQPSSVAQEGAWVTTAAPSYTNATLNALSMNAAGDQRVIAKVTDGTTVAAVKAASTAAAATDPPLVVAQNPLGGNPCKNPSATLAMVAGATTGTAAVQLVALAASQKIYICSMIVVGTSGTTPTFALRYGTGTACATGPITIVGAFTTTANTLFNFSNPFAVTPAGQALCYIQTGTTPISSYSITYVQAP